MKMIKIWLKNNEFYHFKKNKKKIELTRKTQRNTKLKNLNN